VGFLLDDILHAPFWVAVVQIIGVNIILSGDNAVVIALACMRLPPRQRLWGMILGAGVAVLLRILFTLVVAQAMTYPYLKLAGGALLFWVATKLVTEDAEGEGEGDIEAAENLWRAVRIVAIADIVMSLDNVLAIAASADIAAMRVDVAHAAVIKATLIIFGLATSIPLIIAGSAILMALLERFRILVWAGGALLGWVAGDIMATDPAVIGWLGEASAHHLHSWAGRAGAVFVVGLGLLLVRRHRPFQPDEILAAIGLLIWVAGDILIEAIVPATQVLTLWAARGVIALVLAIGYKLSLSRRQMGAQKA
jgi:YjbE family integral membrane protein